MDKTRILCYDETKGAPRMEVLFVNKSSQRYYEYPLHQHGCWELIFSLEGEGTIRIGDDIYPFTNGTVFAIAPWTPHCKSAPEGFIDGCILINGELQFDDGKPLMLQDDGTLQTLFQMAFDTQLKGEAGAAQIISALGDTIYQMLLNRHQACRKPENPAISQFRRRMMDNVTNPDFDISAAMRATGYNDSHLRKLFREAYGRSPVDYFNHLRIDYAKHQLALYHAVRSIREIALDVGFPDPYYFSRLFRKYTGKSPRQYIQELGGETYELLARDLGKDDPEVQRSERGRAGYLSDMAEALILPDGHGD